jgi:hypothetical protein
MQEDVHRLYGNLWILGSVRSPGTNIPWIQREDWICLELNMLLVMALYIIAIWTNIFFFFW